MKTNDKTIGITSIAHLEGQICGKRMIWLWHETAEKFVSLTDNSIRRLFHDLNKGLGQSDRWLFVEDTSDNEVWFEIGVES